MRLRTTGLMSTLVIGLPAEAQQKEKVYRIGY